MKKVLVLLILVLAVAVDSQAQCSMCKAVVESDLKTGSELAEGLNAGILYLMAIPYTLIIVAGVFLFRKMKQNNVQA